MIFVFERFEYFSSSGVRWLRLRA